MATMIASDMPTDTPALSEQGTSLARQVDAITVVDDATFQSAGEMLKAVKKYMGRVHEVMDPVVDAAHKSHKVAVDQRKGLLQHAEAAERVLKDRMAAYEQEQERRRREAELAAERERVRLQEIADAEAQAERERLARETEDIILAEAADAEARGDVATAERLIAAPILIPDVQPVPVFVPPVTVSRPVVAGVGFRDTWSAQCTSLPDLVKAAASGNTVALSCLKFDEARANALARSLKDNLRIPGVKAVQARTTTVRG